ETAELTNLRPEGSGHRPIVNVRMLHDERTIYGIYKVQDRYVLAEKEGFQAPVCEDSCVEFFFKPPVGPGYFNLEMSAGGAYLMSYVRNHKRTKTGFEDYTMVSEKDGALVTVKTSFGGRVMPEITEPVTWYAQFALPMAALEPYCGVIPSLDGAKWRGNFYKCADNSSHPHWLTWNPVSVLNFHLPDCFAELDLA
ncbi:MAG: carbohydrate-binding family 9-like protein, partial [Victivallales bacterium]|nr:carbohydrate-binding family 9-like protein [Victivallales bacterium]